MLSFTLPAHLFLLPLICFYMCMIANVEGLCLLGKVPLELLYLSWEKSPNLKLGERAEIMSNLDMHSCFVKVCHLVITHKIGMSSCKSFTYISSLGTLALCKDTLLHNIRRHYILPCLMNETWVIFYIRNLM